MKRELAVLLVLGIALIGMSGAANYVYEKESLKGTGYENREMIVQTQMGLAGNKLVEKEAGSGVITERNSELEVQRDPFGAASADCMDYINYTITEELEYMPISYQTGTYDEKWISKLCIQNYYIGGVVVDMYTHAEHLQRNTEVKTRRDNGIIGDDGTLVENECGDCTGALEANFNSNVIGVAHIGWLSKDTNVNSKGRHDEYGRSVEDLTGVFSIEKFIQLWGNESCSTVSTDWLPCLAVLSVFR